MGGAARAVASVASSVASAVRDVGNDVSGVVSSIPVIGSPVGKSLEALAGGIAVTPSFIAGVASGQNIGSATGQAITGAAAGEVAVGTSASIGVANQVVPQGVQELPIISNVEALNSSAQDISINQNYSSGAIEQFYRNTAEIGAVALTAGAVATAGAGADAAVATPGEVSVADIGSETAATGAEIGAGAASEGGSSLLTESAIGAGTAGGVAVAKDVLSGKSPSLGDFINGVSGDLGVGDVISNPPQLTKTARAPIASGGNLGGNASFGSPVQASVAILGAIALASILLRRA